jgi:ABC-2 type transport system permease protein
MTAATYLRCFAGIARREAMRFVHQRGRFLSALVRPLVWLAIFAAGFRFVLGVSISPPYETYVLYETYIAPGLLGMILLFQGMQSSLSMVYDREVGSMRVLLTSPLPRWWLLFCKLLAGVLVGVLQCYVFLPRRPLLGGRAARARLPRRAAGAGAGRHDAGRARPAALVLDQAARELRRA